MTAPTATRLRRALPLVFVLAVLGLLGAGLTGGCSKSPEELHGANPFDPNGPTGGDGLNLIVTALANRNNLKWDNPSGHAIDEYIVYRTDDLDAGFRVLTRVDAPQGAAATYDDDYPPAARRLWYKVQAARQDGVTSLISASVAATALTGPQVVVDDTVTNAASRFITVKVVAGMEGTIHAATDPDFVDGLVTVPVVDPAVPVEFPYDLGPAANGHVFSLNVKVVGPVTESATTAVTLTVKFEPKITLVGETALRLARRIVDLKIPATGVDSMRFALDEASLAAAPWEPGADLHPAFELVDSANPQTIWGEFAGDFGFHVIHSLPVRPDLLAGASFSLKVPTTRIVSTPTVTTENSAGATEMRISENPNFAAVAWRAYADTSLFTLSTGEGLKTVYAQFRNDWTESVILSDYCTYLSQGIDVKIVVPAAGTTIEGDMAFTVKGTASPGTVAAALDSVRLDLGDGLGFREVAGTTNWQLNWSVPRADIAEDLVIRARAWAHDTERSYVVTDDLALTIANLTVVIASHDDEDVVTGGNAINLAGEAVPFPGTVVDSVSVTIDGAPLFVSGTEQWSATWNPAATTVDESHVVTATAWSGGEGDSETITLWVSNAFVRIAEPAAAAEITGGTDVAISGTAKSRRGSAAVDSVKVLVGDEMLLAAGTATWSTTWSSPVVTADSLATITALSIAGDDSLRTSIEVTLKP